MKTISENKLNQLIDSYINGNFSQLRSQLKSVSTRQLLQAFDIFETPQEYKDQLLKYKTGVK